MRRWTWVVPAMAAMGLASAAMAADTLASLYHGEPARQANLLLGGWGSGSVKESSEEVLQGSRSLLVTTGGYYTGARIDFSRPLDMSRFATLKGVALQIEVKAVGADSGSDSTDFMFPGGGFFQGPPLGPPMPGGPPMGPPMPGGPPIGPGMGIPGVPGYGTEQPLVPASQKFRVVLFSGSTQVAASDQPLDTETLNNGWASVVIPLAAFRGSAGAPPSWNGFRLNRMLLFGDRPDSFYVGAITLEQLDLAISRVSAGEDLEVYEGDTAEFQAEAQGAGLKYSWDFNAEDGIQEDAIGSKATYRYRKAGTYTVTLTVSDPNGIMAPVADKITVTVNG